MAIDWTSSMTKTYEFYEVDPGTWKDKRRITSIVSCSVKRDSEADTIETASFESAGNDDDVTFNECYIRIYMIVIQNGIRQLPIPLGTFLVQTPSISFDGKIKKVSMDAYSPLLELRDVSPELGFTVMKNQNIMSNVATLTKNNTRAPVVKPTDVADTLYNDFTAEATESWLDYLVALMDNARYHYELDELSRILFAPNQSVSSMQPVWTYTDDNSSILYPDIEDEYDLYGIPNVVEVVYSGDDGSIIQSRIVNDDSGSPTSTVSRGREVAHRETNPSITGTPTQEYIDQYATQLLKSLSSIEHTLSYSHGYCPVRIGDCVRLNYSRAGIVNVKAKVISQDITCSSDGKVTETAVYTTNLWKD